MSTSPPYDGLPTPNPQSGFVRPGEKLRFVQKLQASEINWPLSPLREPCEDPRRPALTPFLVIPAKSGDVGARPLLPDQPVLFNASVQILDKDDKPVFNPKAVTPAMPFYTLTCQVANLGSLGAFGGIMEFYVDKAATFDNVGTGLKPHVVGYAGFSVSPGETKTVKCGNKWKPTTDLEAAGTTLVHAYDAFSDRMTNRFNALTDRHVGRRDNIDGQWEGKESVTSQILVLPGGTSPTPAVRPIRIVIKQDKVEVYYADKAGAFAAAFDNAVLTIVKGLAQFSTKDGDASFRRTWTLTLTPGGLGFMWDRRPPDGGIPGLPSMFDSQMLVGSGTLPRK
ncbi:MAG TPA: hypothetical protein VIX89_20305 [Bryobacteraceae bacterium]